jgi:hypothetical protein
MMTAPSEVREELAESFVGKRGPKTVPLWMCLDRDFLCHQCCSCRNLVSVRSDKIHAALEGRQQLLISALVIFMLFLLRLL